MDISTMEPTSSAEKWYPFLKAFAYPLLSNSLLQLPRVGGITGAGIGIDDLGDGFSLPVGKRELMSR